MKKSILLLIACLLLSMTACGKAENNVNSSNSTTVAKNDNEQLEKIKVTVLDIYLDKIKIVEPDNNFTPSELEDYLKEQNYSKGDIKKAIDYGNHISYISYHINENIGDHTIEEIKSNLLDKDWVVNNNIADNSFTSEEFESGLLVYNHYKETEVY